MPVTQLLVPRSAPGPGLADPAIHNDATRREFIFGAAALSALLVAGCAGDDDPGGATATNATRRVEDALGPVDVPVDPKRVVTLDTFAFEAAMALELSVVAAVANGSMTNPDGVIFPLLDGVEQVGSQIGEPNLEAIAAVRPDLILGAFPNDSPVDAQLKEIAPAYLGIVFESSDQWKEILEAIGAALDRDDDVAALLAEYEQRAATVGERFPSGLSVSSVRAYPDSLSVYGPDSFAGVVMADAGIELVVPGAGEEGFATDLSLEQVGELTADALIVWTANEPDPDAVEDVLRASPLWETLPAVQAGQVAFAGQHWIGSGLIAARAVLDDLEAASR